MTAIQLMITILQSTSVIGAKFNVITVCHNFLYRRSMSDWIKRGARCRRRRYARYGGEELDFLVIFLPLPQNCILVEMYKKWRLEEKEKNGVRRETAILIQKHNNMRLKLHYNT